jgi:hypothetical protein
MSPQDHSLDVRVRPSTVTTVNTFVLRELEPQILANTRSGSPVSLAETEPPEYDERSYTVATGNGASETRCRPYLKVVETESIWLAGPQVRFDRRDDGLYLTVQLEEDKVRRVNGALPFDVSLTSLALESDTDTDQPEVLPFKIVTVTPAEDPAKEPAFRVEADAKVLPGKEAQLIRDLRERGGHNPARWVAELSFDWEPPVQEATPTPFIDVLELAPQGNWQGARLTDASGNATDGDNIPFNGNDGDARGFVILSDAIPLEDGTVRRALRTHPKWVEQGTIKGWLPGQTLPPQARFEAEIGFVAGATGTDGAYFIIFEHHSENGQHVWNEVMRVHKGYTGSLQYVAADLSHLAGQEVGLEIRVDAGPSAGQDWAAWISPTILGTTASIRPIGTQTTTIERRIKADYPKSDRNNPIYAAVDGNLAQTRWQSGPHGWFQPTPLRNTVYCLPDGYRLHVDEVRGLPSIQAVLFRDQTTPMDDSADPTFYKTRLTLRATPYFEPGRRAKLREFIRAQSSDGIKFAELAVGGYRAARFEPDEALAALGKLFAGTTADSQETIDPVRDFTLTYEGNAEFIQLIYERLTQQGIGGEVEFDLEEPGGGNPRKLRVPVTLTLRQLAPVALGVTIADTTAATAPKITIRNPTQRAITVGGIQVFALERSPVTGLVSNWAAATTQPAVAGLSLATGKDTTVTVSATATGAHWNSWEVELAGVEIDLPNQLVMNELFDAATTGVRGWKIDIDSPPLQFFSQLAPEQQEKLKNVVRIEVEVRRMGKSDVEEASLSRDRPLSHVLLTRTVADFLADGAAGRSNFQWRRRLMRTTAADPWSEWVDDSGASISVYA